MDKNVHTASLYERSILSLIFTRVLNRFAPVAHMFSAVLSGAPILLSDCYHFAVLKSYFSLLPLLLLLLLLLLLPFFILSLVNRSVPVPKPVAPLAVPVVPCRFCTKLCQSHFTVILLFHPCRSFKILSALAVLYKY